MRQENYTMQAQNRVNELRPWIAMNHLSGSRLNGISPSHDPSEEEGYAWCGWKVGDQTVWWGAIWQYYEDTERIWIGTPCRRKN